MNELAFHHSLPLTINEGIYSSIAQKLAHGGQLYLNAWDHKPPFIYWAYYLSGLVSKSVESQAHLLAIAAHLACVLLLGASAQRVGMGLGSFLAIASLYLILVLPVAFHPWSAQADLLMQPFLLGAYLLASSLNRQRWFWAGVCWAGAFFFKQSALFYLPLFIYLSQGDRLVLLSDFFWGINALTALVVAPFALSGRLTDFWQAVMGSNGTYMENGWASLWSRSELQGQVLSSLFNGALVYGSTMIATGVVFVGWARQESREAQPPTALWAPMIFWGCSLLACSSSGAFYPYYFVALIPGIVLMLPNCMQWFQTRPPWQLALFALALVVPETAAINRFHSDPIAELDRAGYSWSRMQGAKDVGQYIHARASLNDTLVVWASEPQIYAYSGLPFTCLRTPLVFHLSILPGEIERFESALKKDPPEWFVVGQGSSTPFLPAFALDLLDRRFNLVAELSGKKIFKKKPPNS